jgi:hypothetical protein
LNDDEPYDIWKQVQQKQKVENYNNGWEIF